MHVSGPVIVEPARGPRRFVVSMVVVHWHVGVVITEAVGSAARSHARVVWHVYNRSGGCLHVMLLSVVTPRHAGEVEHMVRFNDDVTIALNNEIDS